MNTRRFVENLESVAFGIMIAGVLGTLFLVPQYSTIGLGLFVGLYLVVYLADELFEVDELVEMLEGDDA